MSAKTLVPVVLLAAVAVAGTAEASGQTQRAACSTSKTYSLGSSTIAYAGVALQPLTAFRAPGRHGFKRFKLRNADGAPTVFNVFGKRVGKRCAATWYHVYLPSRPNMRTAWVTASKIGLVPVHSRIVIDVSARTVTLYRFGRPVLRTPAAVGKPSTPTPLGHYFVSERLVPADPSGPFGPRALGTSAHSNVLSDWQEGGPIGIHGTNEPWSIGKAVSHGCIRVPNSVVGKLFRLSLPGTPITIQR